jgi:capsid protein
MVGWLKGLFRSTPEPEATEPSVPVIGVDELRDTVLSHGYSQLFTGEKFLGGLGEPAILRMDYYTQRAHSRRVFHDNLYARGLIRRLVTNEIATGLSLEATPVANLVGMTYDEVDDWSEDVEDRYDLWAKDKTQCSIDRLQSAMSQQRSIRREALVEGDVLVVLTYDKVTGSPRVRIVPGGAIVNPARPNGQTTHGVERNSNGEHIAFHIRQSDGSTKRLTAYGRRSGRRQAWLVYGTDKLVDGVRGSPLLTLVMQSLREIDRYRDSVQRKAVINSLLAIFIKKDKDKMGSNPMAGAATRRGTEVVGGYTDNEEPRTLNISKHIPGVVLDELQEGEEPHGFNSAGIDLSFGPFEEAIVQTLAWANEVPPEILRLAFSNNYSASQAAINEFKIYLDVVRASFAEQVTVPIYQEWFVSEVLKGRINAPKFLQAWRSNDAVLREAWWQSDWSGAIKPSTDAVKTGRALTAYINQGLTTRSRAARESNGQKYTRVVRQLKRENEKLADSQRPLLELRNEFGDSVRQLQDGGSITDAVSQAVEEHMEDHIEEYMEAHAGGREDDVAN